VWPSHSLARHGGCFAAPGPSQPRNRRAGLIHVTPLPPAVTGPVRLRAAGGCGTRAGAVLSPLAALRTSPFPLTPQASLRSAIRKGHFVPEGLNGGEHLCAPRPEQGRAQRRVERSAAWLPARGDRITPPCALGWSRGPSRGNASRRHSACNLNGAYSSLHALRRREQSGRPHERGACLRPRDRGGRVAGDRVRALLRAWVRRRQ